MGRSHGWNNDQDNDRNHWWNCTCCCNIFHSLSSFCNSGKYKHTCIYIKNDKDKYEFECENEYEYEYENEYEYEYQH